MHIPTQAHNQSHLAQPRSMSWIRLDNHLLTLHTTTFSPCTKPLSHLAQPRSMSWISLDNHLITLHTTTISPCTQPPSHLAHNHLLTLHTTTFSPCTAALNVLDQLLDVGSCRNHVLLCGEHCHSSLGWGVGCRTWRHAGVRNIAFSKTVLSMRTPLFLLSGAGRAAGEQRWARC